MHHNVRVAQLRFLGLSQDGTELLLADSRGRKHSVSVDPRLLAAMRLDGPLTGQREMTLNETLTPREIQARLRAGATVVGLADELGIDADRVERFAGPPLADRFYAAEQAKEVPISSHLGERSLEVTVLSAAQAAGVAPESVRWDAWLREDGSWQVLTMTPAGPVDQVASWVFDPHASTVEADDDIARQIVDGPRQAPTLRTVAPAESADAQVEQPEPGTAPDISDTEENPAGGSATSADDEGEPAAAPQKARRGKRASVPSWDEILFGSSSASEDS